MQIAGMEEEDPLIGCFMKIRKMVNVIFSLTSSWQLFCFFTVEDRIVNSFSFVGQVVSATTSQLFHKAAVF